VILAERMDGKPLGPDHLRVVTERAGGASAISFKSQPLHGRKSAPDDPPGGP
jgi:hypothetical protein